jgi:L-alanine-DL-glutamate epimerase-like enolase superfamily enzyme
MVARAAEAAHLPVLRVELGRGPEFDRAALRAVAAAAPRARLRVDVNGRWTHDQARAMLPALADLGIERVHWLNEFPSFHSHFIAFGLSAEQWPPAWLPEMW